MFQPTTPWSTPASLSADRATRFRLTRVFATAAGDWVTPAALGLTVLGWALIWARALSLFEFVPPEMPIGIFALGLILIPFRPHSRPSVGS